MDVRKQWNTEICHITPQEALISAQFRAMPNVAADDMVPTAVRYAGP